MPTLKPACERCAAPLPPDSPVARVCSHACTVCSSCAVGPLAHRCPNCSGPLERRPARVALPARSERAPCGRARPYSPRTYRFHGVLALGGWRVKCYGLWHADREEPGPAAWDEAVGLAGGVLERAASGGLGFVVLHRGRDGDYLLVDWWSDEDVLNHRLLLRRPGERTFREPREASWTACVWELELIGAERRAWIETAMAGRPERYLERRAPDGLR